MKVWILEAMLSKSVIEISEDMTMCCLQRSFENCRCKIVAFDVVEGLEEEQLNL
jgi:hypothetical protein